MGRGGVGDLRPAMMARRLRRPPWELLLVFAVQLLFLGHALQTYWLGDDLINRSESGALANAGVSYWTSAHDLVDQWWTMSGRFFPISFYDAPPQYMLFHDVRGYKALLLVWTLLATTCVWLLLRELGLGRRAAAVVLLIATIALQFRQHDPVLSYAGLEQLVLAEMSLSLLFFHRWLRSGARKHMALSLLFFVIASLSYESSYVFGPLYAVLALWRRRSIIPAARALVPIFALSIVFLAIGSYGRAHATMGDTGPYAPSFDLREFAYTFVDQLTAAIPLTNAWFDPLHIFHPRKTVILGSLSGWDIVIGLLFAAATALLVRRAGRNRAWSPGLLIVFGLGLWVLTAAPIALATRYQAELTAGAGHIPVFIETFAFGMVVVGAIAWVARRDWPPAMRTGGVAALALVIGATAAVGHRANAVYVESHQPGRVVGLTLEHTARAVMPQRVAAGSTLFLDPPPDTGHSAAFYRQYSGRKYVEGGPLDPAVVAQAGQKAGACQPDRPAAWWVRSASLSGSAAYAVVACAGGPGASLVLHGMSPDRTVVSAYGPAPDAEHAPRGLFALVSRADLDDVRPRVDPMAFNVGPVGDAPVLADWTGGCWGVEQTPKGVGRWCEGDAEITVLATAAQQRQVTLSLPIGAVGEGARRIEVTGAGGVKVAAKPGQPLNVPVTVPARGDVRLRVHVVGGKRFPEAGDRRARLFVGAAIGVS